MPKPKIPIELKPLYDQAYKRLKPITLLNSEARKDAALLASRWKAGHKLSPAQRRKLHQLGWLVKCYQSEIRKA
jgi:hypothetical protein